MEPNLGVADVLGNHTDNPPESRSGDGHVASLGSIWEVSPLEQGIKGQWEQWARRNVVQAIADCEADGFPDEANAMRTAYLTARAAGNYNWQGSVWRASITDIPGSRYLFYLLLRRCHPVNKETGFPGMTIELAGKIFKANPKDCSAAINWALGNEEAPQDGAQKKNGQSAKV